MTRNSFIKHKIIFPDKKYKSFILGKFINLMMKSGKKSVSEKILYDSLNLIKKQYPLKSELDIFEQAIYLIRPLIEVKPRRIGGSIYQVPTELPEERSIVLSIKIIILSSLERKENISMSKRLKNEILDILDNKGNSIKKRDEIHRKAEANKAYAHYR